MIRTPVKRAGLATGVAGTAIVLLVQWSMGVWSAGWGFDPDSPAHLVSALLIREYAQTGIAAGRSPMEFALDYYHRFPKVAIGHWPPLYHACLALWMTFTPNSPPWIHAFQALLAGAVAGLTVLLGSFVLGIRRSVLAGIVVAAAPAILNIGCSMLADLMLAVWVTGGLVAFMLYWRKPGWKPAAWLGACAAAALFTKPTGVILLAIPPFCVLARKRWSLLGERTFWWPALFSLALAGPWYLAFFNDARDGYLQPKLLFSWLVATPLANAVFVTKVLGLAGAILAAAGAWRFRRRTAASLLACSVAAGYLLFTLILPSKAFRHYAPLTPSMAILAVAGLTQILRSIPGCGPGGLSRWCGWLILPVVAASVRFDVTDSGVRPMVESLLARSGRPQTWLVAGSAAFEGDVIAEAALRKPSAGVTVYRGTKLFMRGRWDPWNARLAVRSPAEVAELIGRCSVHTVILGKDSPEVVAAAVSRNPQYWEPRRTGLRREAGVVFERIGPPPAGLGPPLIQKP
jgi:nitrate reductase gamma subunit